MHVVLFCFRWCYFNSEWVGVGCWLLLWWCVGVDRYSGRLCVHCPCAPGLSRAVLFNLLGPMFVLLAIAVFFSLSSLSFLRLSIRIARPRFAPPSAALPLSSALGSCARVSLWPRILSSPRAFVASLRAAYTRRSSAVRLFFCPLLVCAPSVPRVRFP